jgi:hypothetical protein
LLRTKLAACWSEVWREPVAWLTEILAALEETGVVVRVGSDYDRWDLDVSGGRLGGARLLAAFEDNGAGNQYLRFRSWPSASRTACLLSSLCLLGAVGGGLAGSLVACAVLAAAGIALAGSTAAQCADALKRLWATLPLDGQALS